MVFFYKIIIFFSNNNINIKNLFFFNKILNFIYNFYKYFIKKKLNLVIIFNKNNYNVIII